MRTSPVPGEGTDCTVHVEPSHASTRLPSPPTCPAAPAATHYVGPAQETASSASPALPGMAGRVMVDQDVPS